MSSSEDTVGCAIGVVAVIAAGYWLYNKYEVREREAEPIPVLAPVRPTGRIPITELEDGSIWHLDADSVKGDRKNRIGWVISDNSKNPKVRARETKTAYRFDCDSSAYWTLQINEYDKDGKVIAKWSSGDFSKDPSYPPPESNIEAVQQALCVAGFDPAPTPATTASSQP